MTAGVWVKKMNELQKRILDIFKAVAKICKENGITYYAIGGTAIGAVRHQGFIPWDDDLDIAIPIEQYDRFIQSASGFGYLGPDIGSKKS